VIFLDSMSDLFHKDVPDEYIAKVFAVMALAPQHTFQVLTKRHGRMRSLLRSPGWIDLVGRAVIDRQGGWPAHLSAGEGWLPLPNVWVGVSVEDQHWATIRGDALAETPAAVRFWSCEPLLGPVDAGPWLQGPHALDWIVVGGESGHGARSMHPDWARSLRDQCADTGTPYFFKQAGKVLAREWGCQSGKGAVPAEWPEHFPQETPARASL
jgi:protein gp37